MSTRKTDDMAKQSDVRRLALGLPDTLEEEGRFAFSVKNKDKFKGLAWVWMERVDPKKPRVARPDVIAIRVPGLDARDALIASDADKFFTDDHHKKYPAVLVRLPAVDVAELLELLTDAWRCQAPKALVKQHED